MSRAGQQPPVLRPTLEAVAARAGVGLGTVSRVVNGSPNVSAKARAAVEQAIAELGYVPNQAARSLVTSRTDSVALVIPESVARLRSEPYFSDIITGVSSELAETEIGGARQRTAVGSDDPWACSAFGSPVSCRCGGRGCRSPERNFGRTVRCVVFPRCPLRP
ncbi:hypothetical protein GCM10010193_23780 [Kitasatospora atroaurantiaca]|uniref:Regulatory LacI family protein n=1 Tax=Kitasatospora atroaurantiaca TaxID=285545 RepID=A0A561F0Z9_9ACTN|nr:regulatory LacI family protein [Kitasatospora atroaurantiaca]